MTAPDFAEGQRVYHAELGCYGRWLEFVPSESGPTGYSRIEVENCNGRTLLCPTSTLRRATEVEDY